MAPWHETMEEYRQLLQKGAVQQAYRGLMQYILDLRAHLKHKYPDHSVSSSLYQGTMDMTYFAFTPGSLRERNLKIAIVFVHEAFRFEVWLAGANKQVQGATWRLFRESGWDQYPVVPTTEGMDAIVEHVLAEDPDWQDLDALTARIEEGTLRFIADVEGFLATHPLAAIAAAPAS